MMSFCSSLKGLRQILNYCKFLEPVTQYHLIRVDYAIHKVNVFL